MATWLVARGNKMKNQSRSVMRTQNLLKTGLIELMQEKPVQQITVKELVEHVDLNRGTFYLHYKDKMK